MHPFLQRIRPQREFLLFCTVGVINTAVHAIVVIVVMELIFSNQIVANLFGFFIANISSYMMNSIFTFGEQVSVRRYFLFLASSLVALIITIVLSSSAEFFAINYFITLAGLIVLSPIISFLIVRRVAFGPRL